MFSTRNKPRNSRNQSRNSNPCVRRTGWCTLLRFNRDVEQQQHYRRKRWCRRRFSRWFRSHGIGSIICRHTRTESSGHWSQSRRRIFQVCMLLHRTKERTVRRGARGMRMVEKEGWAVSIVRPRLLVRRLIPIPACWLVVVVLVHRESGRTKHVNTFSIQRHTHFVYILPAGIYSAYRIVHRWRD